MRNDIPTDSSLVYLTHRLHYESPLRKYRNKQMGGKIYIKYTVSFHVRRNHVHVCHFTLQISIYLPDILTVCVIWFGKSRKNY